MTSIEYAIERRRRRETKIDIIPIIRILDASRDISFNTLINRMCQLNRIHKELEQRWEIQKRINFSRDYDRWYEENRKMKEMEEAKRADRWPRWFWKDWLFVSDEVWDKYIESKEEEGIE